jgi:hypothetical protein
VNNDYYNQIIELLTQKPEGMKACNIARCIYNSHCNLFDNSNQYHKIHDTIRHFLWQQSKHKNSPFKKVKNLWGVYTLKQSFVTQLELCFDTWEFDIVEKKNIQQKFKQDYNPSLFD